MCLFDFIVVVLTTFTCRCDLGRSHPRGVSSPCSRAGVIQVGAIPEVHLCRVHVCFNEYTERKWKDFLCIIFSSSIFNNHHILFS